MTTQTQFFELTGGLDLVTPAIRTPAGRAIAGLNYEPHPRGYQRCDGYERFDGNPKPSEASYWVLRFDAGTAAIAEDDIVTGATSSATGRAVIDAVVESGSYGGSDAAGYLVLMTVSGTFQDDEDLEVSATKKSEADGTATERGALNDTDDTTWHRAAIEKARDDISAVPGSGPVRGVWTFGGDHYAFRDNAGGTAGVMHKATASGWTAVSLGREIAFTAGGGSIEPIGTLASTPETVADIAGLVDAINHGAVISEESSVPGMTFDGTNDRLDTTTQLQEVNYLFCDTGILIPFTVEARFRIPTASGNHAILMRGGGVGTSGNFALYVDSSGDLQCRLRGGTVTQLAASVDDSAWHTVAVVWDGTTASGYVDGGSATTINVGSATVTTGSQSDNLGIGARADGGGSFFFAGQITDVRVWTSVRTAAEIAANDDARLKGTEEGLLHYWPMSIVEGEFQESQTVTGGTSGASAEIKRVVVESGAFSTRDAAGRLIIGSVTSGPFQDAEALTTSTASGVADGADAAITLPAGGRYDFENHNFFGSSDLKRMYGCQGEGKGFEFDGTVFVPIHTGMADDRPIRVAAQRDHLFFGYRGGSLQHSSLGNPYQWQVITGAGEIGIGEDLTGLLADVSGAFSIFGRNKVAVLFGADAGTWELKTLADDSGAVAWTDQKIGTPIYLDNGGLRSLETTDRFGDFAVGTLTQIVEPLFRTNRKAGVTAVGSLRVRNKDQYRLFWSDGTVTVVYFGREFPEVLPLDLDLVITCSASGKDDDGEEVLLVGDADGMVYELDAGTSFDGEEVKAFLRLPFNHSGSPAQRKRYQKAVVELDGGPDTQIGMISEFSYGDPDQPPNQEQTFAVKGGGGFWNEFNWDNFYWSSPVEGQAELYIDGIGKNVSITIISDATYEVPHVLQGVVLYFSYRGLAR